MQRNIRALLTVSALYLGLNSALAQSLASVPAAGTASAANSARRHPAGVPPRFAPRYARFAGSAANAQALLHGLQTGTTVTLAGDRSASGISFTLPCGPMPWHDVRRVLDLAQAHLAACGIDRPSPRAIKAALLGGDLPATDRAGSGQRLAGVLKLLGKDDDAAASRRAGKHVTTADARSSAVDARVPTPRGFG